MQLLYSRSGTQGGALIRAVAPENPTFCARVSKCWDPAFTGSGGPWHCTDSCLDKTLASTLQVQKELVWWTRLGVIQVARHCTENLEDKKQLIVDSVRVI
jgi:hypothetical protein